jgi:hypothetical protein
MRVFDHIALLFSGAVRAAKKNVSFVEAMDSRRRKAFDRQMKQVIPALDAGLKLADNVDRQSLEVLRRKEQLARNLKKVSARFWKRQEKRIVQVKNLVRERPETQEQKLLSDEAATLHHILDDTDRIQELVREHRLNDIEPLIAKANHAAKIINVEERMRAVNPDLLREFDTYEKAVQKQLAAADDLAHHMENDEFEAMKQLLRTLRKETIVLQQESWQAQPRERKVLDRRMKQIIASSLMLENALELATCEDVKDKRIRERAIKVYELLEWLRKVDESERQLIGKPQ